MRSYNYVVIPTHDFDKVVYKIRAIDFDQQCFEGNLQVYRPQFFKENNEIMNIVKEKLESNSVKQYKIEERSILEVSHFYGVDSSNVLSSVQICEDNTIIKNFAFDVTPAELVTAIITEKGVFEATEASLKNLLD